MTYNLRSSHLRGPTEHGVRDLIVKAATGHFGRYGYEKSTVSNLAKSIGFSKAYIYKFFDSKRAIGEVVCANRFATVIEVVGAMVLAAPTAPEKIRALFCGLEEAGGDLLFQDRKLYDIAAIATLEEWSSVIRHEERIRKCSRKSFFWGGRQGCSSENPRLMKSSSVSI